MLILTLPLQKKGLESSPFFHYCTKEYLGLILLSAYRTECVGFNADRVRFYLALSAFYLLEWDLKGGQNVLIKSLKPLAISSLNKVLSFYTLIYW